MRFLFLFEGYFKKIVACFGAANAPLAPRNKTSGFELPGQIYGYYCEKAAVEKQKILQKKHNFWRFLYSIGW